MLKAHVRAGNLRNDFFRVFDGGQCDALLPQRQNYIGRQRVFAVMSFTRESQSPNVKIDRAFQRANVTLQCEEPGRFAPRQGTSVHGH
ncbi:hypothetical protein QN397_18895 [Variovorax sp. RTB1]|nr:hypothetical protein [Variovorax sp. RTB1]